MTHVVDSSAQKTFFRDSRSSDISCLLIFSFSHVLVHCFCLLSKGLWHLKPLLQCDSNLHLPTQHLVSVCTVGIMLGYYITLHCKHLCRDKCVSRGPTFTIWAFFLFHRIWTTFSSKNFFVTQFVAHIECNLISGTTDQFTVKWVVPLFTVYPFISVFRSLPHSILHYLLWVLMPMLAGSELILKRYTCAFY